MALSVAKQNAYYQRLLVILAHEFDKYLNCYRFKQDAFIGRVHDNTHPKTTFELLLDSGELTLLEVEKIGLLYGAVISFSPDRDCGQQPDSAINMCNVCLFLVLDVFREDAGLRGHETPEEVRVPLADLETGELRFAVVLERDGRMRDVVGEEVLWYTAAFDPIVGVESETRGTKVAAGMIEEDEKEEEVENVEGEGSGNRSKKQARKNAKEKLRKKNKKKKKMEAAMQVGPSEDGSVFGSGE